MDPSHDGSTDGSLDPCDPTDHTDPVSVSGSVSGSADPTDTDPSKL